MNKTARISTSDKPLISHRLRVEELPNSRIVRKCLKSWIIEASAMALRALSRISFFVNRDLRLFDKGLEIIVLN